MAVDLKAYYARIRAIAAQLPADEVSLISVENPERATVGGVVNSAERMLAARAIADRTHRLATPEEIEAAKHASESRMAGYEEKNKKRAPLEVVADRLTKVIENQESQRAEQKRARA